MVSVQARQPSGGVISCQQFNCCWASWSRQLHKFSGSSIAGLAAPVCIKCRCCSHCGRAAFGLLHSVCDEDGEAYYDSHCCQSTQGPFPSSPVLLLHVAERMLDVSYRRAKGMRSASFLGSLESAIMTTFWALALLRHRAGTKSWTTVLNVDAVAVINVYSDIRERVMLWTADSVTTNRPEVTPRGLVGQFILQADRDRK